MTEDKADAKPTQDSGEKPATQPPATPQPTQQPPQTTPAPQKQEETEKQATTIPQTTKPPEKAGPEQDKTQDASKQEKPEEKKPTEEKTQKEGEGKEEKKEGEASEKKESDDEKPTGEEKKEEAIVVDEYSVFSGNLEFPVKIVDAADYVLHYEIQLPHVDFVTRALLDETKRSLVGEIQLESREITSSDKFKNIRAKFLNRSKAKLKNVLKKASDEYVSVLSLILVNEMVGLGDMEYLLLDDHIEEIVVNSSKDKVWVYHKQHGWVKTNIIIPTEDLILNYSARVAREVGREISHLEPLLDAHLEQGDRVNATLYPVSTFGNTITIRRFSRTPWTVTHLIDDKIRTINPEAAAFLWLGMEYELSMLVAGGTASGKTSMLNALMPFIPANHRVVTIEDTRELNLPEYMHWVPLTTRPPNPQGEGEVSMLDLVENSLRMRPDRICVGEVRRKREAEVLFEAMHTGHSVYGTFHAERANEVVDRLTGPPMNIPGQVMKSLHLIVVQYRNRRTGFRRTFEIAEILKDESEKVGVNILYAWNALHDRIEPLYPSIRIKEDLALFTGMSDKEIEEDLKGKMEVLMWMNKQNIRDVNDVGKIVTEYYIDKDTVLELVHSGETFTPQ